MTDDYSNINLFYSTDNEDELKDLKDRYSSCIKRIQKRIDQFKLEIGD